jgi:hypothetical protein
MSTGARGEGYLDPDSEHHPLLFTNRALAEGERALGRSVLDYARDERMSMTSLARLMSIGLEAARKDRREARRSYTVDDAFNLLDEFGFTRCAEVVFEALATVLGYKGGETSDNPPA